MEQCSKHLDAIGHIAGSGRLIGDLHFSVTISNRAYSVEQVRDQLQSGGIHLYFEDATLFDDDGEILGKVAWSEDKGTFVIRAADPT